MSRAMLCLLALFVAGSSSSSPPWQRTWQPRGRFQQGVDAHARGDWHAALHHFQAALEAAEGELARRSRFNRARTFFDLANEAAPRDPELSNGYRLLAREELLALLADERYAPLARESLEALGRLRADAQERERAGSSATSASGASSGAGAGNAGEGEAAGRASGAPSQGSGPASATPVDWESLPALGEEDRADLLRRLRQQRDAALRREELRPPPPSRPGKPDW